MIEEITVQEAEEKAKNLSDKLLVVFLTQKDCPVCGPWLQDIWGPIMQQKGNEIEAYKVYVEDMVFKPANSPTTYFFVPNKQEYNPIIRPGTAPFEMVWEDLERILEMKNTGKTIKEVFYG